MIEIYSDTKTNLSFSLDIENNQDTPKLRFVLKFEDDTSLMFSATQNENKAEVVVPKLSEILKRVPDSCKACLEAIVDGTYFIPWEDEVQFKNVVAVSANLSKYGKQNDDDNQGGFDVPDQQDDSAEDEDHKKNLVVKASIAEETIKDVFDITKPKKEPASDLRKFLEKKSLI